MKGIDYVKSQLSKNELLCGLAEEAAELAKAALKLRRCYDGSNPTPASKSEAFENLKEEIADVSLYLKILGLDLYYDAEIAELHGKKLARWVKRLRGMGDEE